MADKFWNQFLTSKRLIIAMIIALLGVGVLALLHSPSLALRGDRRDHISQISSALILDCMGFDIFRKAPQDLLTRDLSPETLDWGVQHGIPDFELFKWPACTAKPIAIVWPHIPRPYGPGIFILLKPIAELWNHDVIDFRTAQYLTFFVMIFFAVLASFLFSTLIHEAPLDTPAWLRRLLCVFFTIDAVRWALNGQFDSISIFFLLVAFSFFRKKAFLQSLFFFALCFFFQFRTLFWLPLILVSMSKLPQQLRYIGSIKMVLWISGGLIIAAIGLYVFGLCYAPIQMQMAKHITNPLFLNAEFHFKEWIGVLLAYFLASFTLLKERLYLTLLQLFWILFMLAQMPYVLGMHALFVIPILSLPFIERSFRPFAFPHEPLATLERPKKTGVLLSLLLYYSVLAGTVFTNNPLEFNGLKELLHAF